jgi:hypothetical protein
VSQGIFDGFVCSDHDVPIPEGRMASQRNSHSFHFPEEEHVNLHPALSLIDSTKAEWVIGGMNKAELISAYVSTTTNTSTSVSAFITPDEGGPDLI